MIAITNPNTGEDIELTPENTMIFLFRTGNDLDHVMVNVGDNNTVVCYDPQLLQVATALQQFPLVLYPTTPTWAIDRRMMQETDDIDKLLADGE